MPCKVISPHFERLANEYSESALFLKVDVDECADVAATQGISALPTFVFYKNKEVVDRVQGSHPVELEGKIKSYVSVRDENNELQSDSNQATTASDVTSTASLQEKRSQKPTKSKLNVKEKKQ